MAVFIGENMFDNIMFCINAILPVFLIIVLGNLLYKTKFLSDGFINTADKLVFKCALPASLFYNVATTDFTKTFNGKLTSFCVIGIICVFLVITVTVGPAIKRKDIRGAVLQGIYRSNFAILGIPLAQNLFGDAGATLASLLISFVIPLYNVLAVVILAMNMPSESRESAGKIFIKIVKNIITNPLIIAVVLAIPFSLHLVSLPTVLDKSISYLSDLSTPLALISLGASFKLSDLKGKLGYSLFAVFMKIVVCPAVFCTIGAYMGFRGVELGMILIAFGAPTAVSSYIMAKQMKSNYEVASQIIVISTLLCSVTLLIGSFVLKTLNLI